MRSALQAIRDRDLPERLIAGIGALEQRTDEAGCIKLLLCKCAPFVWGMQRSIAERLDGVDGSTSTASADNAKQPHDAPNNDDGSFTARLDGFFKHLPALSKFRENGAECERRHAACFGSVQPTATTTQ